MANIIEEIAKNHHTCTCGEIYTSREMAAPDCILCNADFESVATEYAQHLLSEKEAEIKLLKNWRDSANDILRKIDLQECSKVMNLQLGSDIAKYILPALRELKQLKIQQPTIQQPSNGVWRTMKEKEPPIGDNIRMKWEGGTTEWVGNFYEEVLELKEEYILSLLWWDKNH